jgi:hypothetical protein
MTAVRFTGRDLKILWLCALTCLVMITAYTRLNTVGDQLRAAQAELPASASYTIVAPAQESRVALQDDAALSGLSIYMQLHETRDADMSGIPPVANACSGTVR